MVAFKLLKVYILVQELCLLFWRITLLLWSFELTSRIQVVKLEVTEIYYYPYIICSDPGPTSRSWGLDFEKEDEFLVKT